MDNRARWPGFALNVALALTAISAVTAISLRLREIYLGRHPVLVERRLPQWRWLDSGSERSGPADAKVEIIEFADFQCPFCARAEPELDQLRQQFPREVAVVFRNLPIAGHTFALSAARAGECAARLGRFTEFKRILYASQDLLGKVSFERLAGSAGVADAQEFEHCLTDPGISRAIAEDAAAAARLGVDATPTFVVNGLEIVGYSGPPELTKAVVSALKAANGGAGH